MPAFVTISVVLRLIPASKQGSRGELLLHFVESVDLRCIDGRNAELQAVVNPPVDLLCGRLVIEQSPGSVDHARKLRAMRCNLYSFHALLAILSVKEAGVDLTARAAIIASTFRVAKLRARSAARLPAP